MAKALYSILIGRTTFLGFAGSQPCRPSTSSCPCGPLVICMGQKKSSWADIESDIEIHLKKSIPIRHPIDVFEPMHYLTFAAPRTRAPALCIAACELVGGDRDQAMAAAAAIHLVHAAAYTHEHLPLTDRTRPKPGPSHHKYNSNVELLTGDGILPYGFELLARSMDSSKNRTDRILRVIIEISQASGAQGIVEGQYKELDISAPETDIELIEYVCKKKEGELHACGAACGAILGGGSEEEIEKLRKYGLYFGMIQGLVRYGAGRSNRKGIQEMLKKLRVLAMKELESFKSRDQIETISALLES